MSMPGEKSAAYKEWITRVFDCSSNQYSQLGPRFFNVSAKSGSNTTVLAPDRPSWPSPASGAQA